MYINTHSQIIHQTFLRILVLIITIGFLSPSSTFSAVAVGNLVKFQNKDEVSIEKSYYTQGADQSKATNFQFIYQKTADETYQLSQVFVQDSKTGAFTDSTSKFTDLIQRQPQQEIVSAKDMYTDKIGARDFQEEIASKELNATSVKSNTNPATGFRDATNPDDIFRETLNNLPGNTVGNPVAKTEVPDEDPSTGLTLVPAAGGVYTLLAPIPTFFPDGKIDIKGKGLSGYLEGLYRVGVAIATGLALIMIVVGGLEYVSTDSIQGKSSGRERIKNALIGLLLALTSFIILRQINPNLLRSDLGLDTTGSVGGIDAPNVNLTSGNVEYAGTEGYPLTRGLINGSISGTQFNIYTNTPIDSVSFVATPGPKYIGGGKVTIDYDGSPGAYRLTESPNGPYIIRGRRYVSSGYEHVANARSDVAMSTAAMKSGGRWVGVQTASDGEPIINSDGSLIGVLSIGAGKVNGDITAFVALSSGQIAVAKSKFGVDLRPSLSTTVILTANGRSIKAIYADYAGIRSTDYSEISPAAAKALGISFGKQNGKSYASGSVTISLP